MQFYAINYIPHVLLVNPHTKGDGSNNTLNLVPQPFVVDYLTFSDTGRENGMNLITNPARIGVNFNYKGNLELMFQK